MSVIRFATRAAAPLAAVPLALTLALAAPAAANDELMAGFYDNTVVVSLPNGNVLQFWFDPDNTFETSDGLVGSWRTDADTQAVCITMETEPGTSGTPEACYPLGGVRQPGDTFTVKTPDGVSRTATIELGREVTED